MHRAGHELEPSAARRAERDERPVEPTPANHLLLLQQGAGNHSVARMLAARGVLARTKWDDSTTTKAGLSAQLSNAHSQNEKLARRVAVLEQEAAVRSGLLKVARVELGHEVLRHDFPCLVQRLPGFG